jgi:hypothetical protein
VADPEADAVADAVADADAVGAEPVADARAGAATVPRTRGTATASVQRAARAQRVDTGRG